MSNLFYSDDLRLYTELEEDLRVVAQSFVDAYKGMDLKVNVRIEESVLWLTGHIERMKNSRIT